MADAFKTMAPALMAALLCGAASAEEPKPSAEAFVDLATTPLPVVVDGRLVNYVFVVARLQLAPGVDNTRVREQEPFFRDLLVREGGRRPFTRPGDLNAVDEGRIRSLLRTEAVRRVGPGVVRDVAIVSATPRARVYAPRGAAHRGIVP